MTSEVQGRAGAGLPAAGAAVGPFELLRLIEEAENWRTFEASHQRSGELFTVRILTARLLENDQVRERFARHVSKLQAVATAGVEALQGIERLPDGNWLAITGEREGQSFAERLRDDGAIPAGELAILVPKVIALLSATNAAGIEGVVATPGSIRLLGDESLRLTDAGFGHLLTGALGMERSLIETVYSAPELLRGGAPTPSSQIYAVGVLIAELLSARLPTLSPDPAKARALQTASGFALPIPAPISRLPVATVIRRACAPDPAMRYVSLRELEAHLVAALTRPPEEQTHVRLIKEILLGLAVTAITGVITGFAAPYVPGACGWLASATAETALADLAPLVCGEPPPPVLDPAAEAMTAARHAFAEIRPRVFDCVMEELGRRQTAAGSAEVAELLPELTAADAAAAEAARAGSGEYGSGSGSGVGSGSGSGSGSGVPSSGPAVEPLTARLKPNPVPVALVARPVQLPEGSHADAVPGVEQARRDLGHVELLALVGEDGLARELVIPEPQLSEEARACIAAATSKIQFPMLLAGASLAQSYWLFGATPPVGLPDDVDNAVLTAAVTAHDPRAESHLSRCVAEHVEIGAGGAVHIEGKLWIGSSGVATLLELDPARFPAAFRACAEQSFDGLAIPATARVHGLTAAWNCSTGSKSLCARERSVPASPTRSHPSL